MSNTPDCSLIVTAYNQAPQMRLVLQSAALQGNRNFEIIVADDGSSDDLAAVIEAFSTATPDIPVRHLWHEDNGFRKTIILNRAVRESASDYLVFLDGDMILHPRFIEMHLAHAHPEKVLCGWRGVKLGEALARQLLSGKTQFNSSALAVFAYALKGDLSRPFRGLVVQNRLLRSLLATERGRLSGCNYSLYKRCYIQANGMDETILQYGYEDYEFGHRLQLNDIRLTGISHCANTFHLEHAKQPGAPVREIKARIDRSSWRQCRHGYEKREEGSSNPMFLALKE